MKIAVATTPKFFVEENAIIHALFEEGLDYIHINKPGSEPIYCERLLTLMQPQWYSKTIVDDHFYLQNEYNLKGIHLSNRNSQIPEGYKGFITRLCNIDEIDRWIGKCGYVILNANPTIINLAKAEHIISHKVYARGVTTIDGLQFVQDNGFGGFILEDVLWNKFDHHESSDYKDLIELFKKFRKATD